MPDKPEGHLLIIDDDELFLDNLETALSMAGYEVESASSPEIALKLLKERSYDLVITDLRMPGTDGLYIYEAIRDVSPFVPVIVLTGHGHPQEAARAIEMGCTDYLRKPITLDELNFRVDKALRQQRVEVEVASLREQLHRASARRTIVGSSPAIRAVLDKIAMVAKSSATVLIRGETGTGKELVARAVHDASPRSNASFVAVACAAIPQPLFEGQLFGHKRGAYTGADRDQKGLIDVANKGTLFLDEIGDIDAAAQVKLLRTLETGELRPLGDRKGHKVDIRLIAATNRDLERAIEEGQFRADLFYRLNVFPVTLPPLRDRKEDIPLLVKHFADLHSPDLCGEDKIFSTTAIERLVAYDWPGNVRELENKVRQAILLSPTKIVNPSSIDIPVEVSSPTAQGFSDAKKAAIDSFERRFVREALKSANGVVSKAARLMDLDRKNLWLLMKKHGIQSDEFR
ncbi:MAG: sigma-54-dependent Fis family transcriptional regulator [Candidatus Coatesbacteria bacterium]|nr:sigma-54-dependent Fis family transcriptional regulator [Candidatus Coatesbacteria bacterium]